jgi:hypothetical protein
VARRAARVARVGSPSRRGRQRRIGIQIVSSSKMGVRRTRGRVRVTVVRTVSRRMRMMMSTILSVGFRNSNGISKVK